MISRLLDALRRLWGADDDNINFDNWEWWRHVVAVMHPDIRRLLEGVYLDDDGKTVVISYGGHEYRVDEPINGWSLHAGCAPHGWVLKNICQTDNSLMCDMASQIYFVLVFAKCDIPLQIHHSPVRYLLRDMYYAQYYRYHGHGGSTMITMDPPPAKKSPRVSDGLGPEVSVAHLMPQVTYGLDTKSSTSDSDDSSSSSESYSSSSSSSSYD